LLEQKLEYVYDRGFDQPDAESRFLAPMPVGSHRELPTPRPPTGLSPYMANYYGSTTLLRRDEEVYLFLKMNYLKFRASELRKVLDPSCARGSELAEIDRLQGEALTVKNQIIQANLRLVVSIARRQVRLDRGFLELVSEGNLSLILAVEKFDVSRGYKFSTYASCAIMKNLARRSAQEISRHRRFVTGQHDVFEAAADRRIEERETRIGGPGNEQAVQGMLSCLSARERGVIVCRFGLEGARAKTLRQLGEELGITKERVRQIESRAREKLRKFAMEVGLDPTAA
jgi:RNA polymerase primary sigma factor